MKDYYEVIGWIDRLMRRRDQKEKCHPVSGKKRCLYAHPAGRGKSIRKW